jgi:hypothetical protein
MARTARYRGTESSESNTKRKDRVMFSPTVNKREDGIVMSGICDPASVLCRSDSTHSMLLVLPLFFDASTNSKP